MINIRTILVSDRKYLKIHCWFVFVGHEAAKVKERTRDFVFAYFTGKLFHPALASNPTFSNLEACCNNNMFI